MVVAGSKQEIEFGGEEREQGCQFMCERAAAASVLGVVAVVLAHRVVEEREEEHDLGVGAGGGGGEFEPVLADLFPVAEPVQVRAVRARAREDGVECVLDGGEAQGCFPRRWRCDW